jgi:hypothetical protein
MRPASPELEAFLASARAFIYVDVFTFELPGGTDDNYRLRYTSGQQNLTTVPVGGVTPVTYRADKVLISGLRAKAAIGLEVTEQTILITPQAGALVQGLTFQTAARRRVFDGAIVRRDRFFFEAHGQPPVGGVPMFAGLISTFDSIGRSQITLKVKSGNVLLNQVMPRHLFQPACIYTIFDTGCGLDPDALAVHGVVESGATATFIPWAALSDSGFTIGKVFFENMGNVGTWRTIRTADATGLTLAYPLPEVPAAGDLFVAYPGCDGSAARCAALGNTANRRSYDFVPQSEKAI